MGSDTHGARAPTYRASPDMSGASPVEREDGPPIVLHADDRPPSLHRLVIQRLAERSDPGVGEPLGGAVGVLARRVVVQQEHGQPWTGAGLGVLEHLPVAGR